MAHNNFYLDLCVDTYVVHEGRVLLRMHEKYHNWGSPGGHIDPGEDVNEAALREVWEEAGLRVTLVGPKGWVKRDTETNLDLVPPVFVNRHKITPTHDHCALVFVARSDSKDINPQTEADRGAECIWVNQSELDALLATDSRLRKEVHTYASTALTLCTPLA